MGSIRGGERGGLAFTPARGIRGFSVGECRTSGGSPRRRSNDAGTDASVLAHKRVTRYQQWCWVQAGPWVVSLPRRSYGHDSLSRLA